jgi:WD40 repeat protein
MATSPERRDIKPEDRLVAAFGRVRAVAAWTTADGPRLASAGDDGTIRRWNATTGGQVGEPMTGHTDWVIALATWIGRDGPMLASAGIDGTIRRWNATSGTQFGEPMISKTGTVQALATWTGPDGPMLASASRDGTIRRWNATTGGQVGEPMTGHTDTVRALAAVTTKDGPMLASAGDDGTIRRWNATTGGQVGEPMTGHTDWLTALATWSSPDGYLVLASAGDDGKVRRWNATTGGQVGEPMTGHIGAVLALASWTGPDGPMLASASVDGTIRRWNATTGGHIGEPMTGHTDWVQALASWTGPDGPMLASASDDATIRRWNATTGGQVGEPMTGHTGSVDALVSWISADGYAMLASASDDGTIRRWNAAAATPAGEPLQGSRLLAAWTGPDGRTTLVSSRFGAEIRCWDATAGTLVRTLRIDDRRGFRPFGARRDDAASRPQCLTGWTGPDGHLMLASASRDGTIRRWNATTGAQVGEPMTGHTEQVVALTTWTGPDGPMLASAGIDGTIRRWNATTGAQVGEPMTGHGNWVDVLTTWTGLDGPMLASAGIDGTIRRWDATTGAQVGEPMTGHTNWIEALTTWTGPNGPMLASAGRDRTIRRWNATTGAQVGEPMTGHTDTVQALATWTSPDGPVIASAGADGTIRVWHAGTGELLHRVLVEPIRLRGLADRPAARDLLGRGALTQALANLLLWRPTSSGGETGPSVVTFEGPWGTGKTTVMRLVEARIGVKPEDRSTRRQMSAAAAFKILRKSKYTENPATMTSEDYRGSLTAWFNPWAYQSSEQVWAGLARSITDAAKPILYPDKAEDVAQSYWLNRNAPRIDRFAVSRSLLLRVVSPLLGLSAITAIAPVLISLAKLNTSFHIAHQRVTLNTLALIVALALLCAGILDTIRRYFSPASWFLPGDLIRGPILSSSLSEGVTEVVKNLRDPIYQAKSGYLHLVQEDTATTIRDLRNAGYDLVVFIDDLDRCSARTTAEVFEAINLFLSGATELQAKFVIGLDPTIVAAHLDTVYEGLDDDKHLIQYGDDPSPGWAFLRKVVQLPIGAPRVNDLAIDQFLGAALDLAPQTVRESTDAVTANVQEESDEHRMGLDPPSPVESSSPPATSQATEKEHPQMGSLERQPKIVALIRQRLADQPERSAREAKRLLNVWQLYQRVLDLDAPLSHDDAIIERACHLVILAEIVTRWPALQRRLHQSLDGRRGLQILATACDEDSKWADALTVTGLSAAEYSRAVENLRSLLRSYEGRAVADLAARVL